MRNTVTAVVCCMLAACSHVPIPHFSKQPVVGIVEFDTGLTRFSTMTGIYHQDMCSKANPDAQVHLSDSEMGKILAQADKIGFYKVKGDLTTNWPDPAAKPPHCATFRLHVESGALHNEVRWDCRADGSNAPPVEVEPLVELIQKDLHSKPEVRAMPWSNCSVH